MMNCQVAMTTYFFLIFSCFSWYFCNHFLSALVAIPASIFVLIKVALFLESDIRSIYFFFVLFFDGLPFLVPYEPGPVGAIIRMQCLIYQVFQLSLVYMLDRSRTLNHS